MKWLILALFSLFFSANSRENLRRRTQEKVHVKVFHFIINHWGESVEG